MHDSSLSLARLRRRLEQLEPRRAASLARPIGCGHGEIDGILGGGFARGRLHEIFLSEEDASGGAGFAAALCLRGGMGQALLWLRTEGAQKRAGLVHAAGLRELGLDPALMLLGVVPDEAALLRAAGEAARCAGLGALLIESWGPMPKLDLTASRRLMLAAEQSGVTLLLLRIAADPAPSAAETRWRVSAAPSVEREAHAPGAPMFELELLRRRAGPPAGPWRVEWDRDRLCFRDPIADERRQGPPLSRPVLPLVAGGAAAADAPAPLRRTG